MTITLEKAIEILTHHQKGTDPLYLPNLAEAEALGIEALKWRIHDEKEVPNWAACPLPGETKGRTIQRQGKDIRGDYSYEEAQK